MIPIRKSLGYRILFIFFILLCLPIIVDSFILFNQSFKEGEENAKKMLLETSIQRQFTLVELVPSHSPIVELIANQLQLKENFPKEPSKKLNDELAKLAAHGDFSAIVLLKKGEKNEFNILGSSLDIDIGKTNTEYVKSIITPGTTDFTLFYITGEKQLHFVNAYHIFSNDQTLLGILLVYTDISQKLNTLLLPDISHYPIFFSILLKNSIIFAGTDPNLNMNYFVPLQQENKERFLLRINQIRELGIQINDLPMKPLLINHGDQFPYFTFQWLGEEWLAYISQIGNSEYYLMTYLAKNEISEEIFSNFIRIYGNYGLILLIGGILALGLTKRFSKPLNTLTETMQEIQKKKTFKRNPYDPLGFEVNMLSTNFNDMVDNVIAKEKIAEEERLKWELYKKELSLGEEIQKRLFTEKKVITKNVEIETAYLPALEVGGDFCDHFMYEDKLVLMIADAAGKGVEACFYSLIVRSLLRIFSQEINETSTVIEKTNSLFLKDVEESGIFVTVVIAFYNPKTRILTYYCGGHNSPILRRKNGSIELLGRHGAALGIDIGSHISQAEEIYMNPGDTIVFYTDGVTEAHNREKELFSEKSLIEIIKKEGDQNALGLCNTIIETVRKFENGALQHDDITLMVMKVKEDV